VPLSLQQRSSADAPHKAIERGRLSALSLHREIKSRRDEVRTVFSRVLKQGIVCATNVTSCLSPGPARSARGPRTRETASGGNP
jgi:hypothetical protein